MSQRSTHYSIVILLDGTRAIARMPSGTILWTLRPGEEQEALELHGQVRVRCAS